MSCWETHPWVSSTMLKAESKEELSYVKAREQTTLWPAVVSILFPGDHSTSGSEALANVSMFCAYQCVYACMWVLRNRSCYPVTMSIQLWEKNIKFYVTRWCAALLETILPIILSVIDSNITLLEEILGEI